MSNQGKYECCIIFVGVLGGIWLHLKHRNVFRFCSLGNVVTFGSPCSQISWRLQQLSGTFWSKDPNNESKLLYVVAVGKDCFKMYHYLCFSFLKKECLSDHLKETGANQMCWSDRILGRLGMFASTAACSCKVWWICYSYFHSVLWKLIIED